MAPGDIYTEVLAMESAGLSPEEIAQRIYELATKPAGGFPHVGIVQEVRDRRGLPTFTFPGREVIRFDGTKWHYEVP